MKKNHENLTIKKAFLQLSFAECIEPHCSGVWVQGQRPPYSRCQDKPSPLSLSFSSLVMKIGEKMIIGAKTAVMEMVTYPALLAKWRGWSTLKNNDFLTPTSWVTMAGLIPSVWKILQGCFVLTPACQVHYKRVDISIIQRLIALNYNQFNLFPCNVNNAAMRVHH